MPLAAHTNPIGIKGAAHLLRRAAFGATPSQIESFKNDSGPSAIAKLFPNSTQGIPTPPIDAKTGAEWVTNGPTSANSEEFVLGQYFMGWFLSQMLATGIAESQALAYSAREKVVLFLHTHFTCIANKVQSSRALYFQNQLFRQYADKGTATYTKSLKTLTEKISVDNARVKLLDSFLNVKGSVNENYGRELLELYSIGRGLEGKPLDIDGADDYGVYREQDVQQAARVLSGWDFDDTFGNIDPETNLPCAIIKSNGSAHDNSEDGPKQFSDRLGDAVVTPLTLGTDATEESMRDEIQQLVNIIYDQPDNRTARNIAWKLYRFFVYAPHEQFAPGNLVAKIDDEIIDVMAEDLRANGYMIMPVIENLLASQHFYEALTDYADDNFGGIIKSPLDLALGTLKAFKFQLPDVTVDAEKFYATTTQLLYSFQTMGLRFYEPFDVAGYEGYHQFPLYHRAWITPTSLANRYAFVRSLFTDNPDELLRIDPLAFVKDNPTLDAIAADSEALTMQIALYLLPVSNNLTLAGTDPNAEITYERMNFFRQSFLGTFDAAYWTSNWNAYNNLDDLRGFLKQLFNAMMQSPEYQLQ